MRHNYSISAVIPCYNEEAGIAAVIQKMPNFIDEIIVVDNASTDKTSQVAANLGAKVVYEAQPGYGRAYKTGLPAAQGDLIVTMDGDATYPTIAIGYLVDILKEENLDFVSAARLPVDYYDSIEFIKRHLGNKVLTTVLWLLFGIRIRDSQSGMWVFKKSVLDKVKVLSNGMPFSEEFKIKAFLHPEITAREVPISFRYLKREGVSKLNLWKDGFFNLLYLFRLRFGWIKK